MRHLIRGSFWTGIVIAAMGMNARADLVVNGDFETGDFTGWNVNSPDGFTFVDTGFSHSGNFSAFFGDFQSDGGGSISQSLATTANTQYTLTFWFAGDGDSPSGFSAIVGGSVLFDVTDPAFDPDYLPYSFNFTATSASTLLTFTGYDDAFFVNLDDVSVNVASASVPEPASAALLAIGVGAIVLVRKRRRVAI